MPEKAPPASHPVFIEKPLVPPLTPTQNTLETTVTLPPQNLSTIGPAGSTQSVPPLQPSKAVDARPKGNPAEWVTTDDYPAAALRNSQQGRTSFRLDIGADGRPTGCSIVQSSGSSDLDQAACRTLMHRAHFNAARDAAGMPVPSTYANNVLWRLPRD
jgi:protein TonB